MRPSIFALPALIVLSACGGGASGVPSAPKAAPAPDLTSKLIGSYIKHVVIIVQENRSFDNIFAGYAGANSQMYGYLHNGTKVTLQPIPFEVKDMAHYYRTGIMDYDGGKMDKFDLNPAGGGTIGTFAYSYLQRTAVAPYWTIAQRYVLADHMFPTMWGPSYTGHLTLIASMANLSSTVSEADLPTQFPWGCDAPAGTITTTVSTNQLPSQHGPFPCYTQFRTLAATLDAAGVSWKYYAPSVGTSYGGNQWSAFDSIHSVRYSTDWKAKVISPPQQVLIDSANGALPGVSWVIPDADWSDHPYNGKPYGPSWVANVINSIGTSSQWKSTAIVVVWDDWGGFFDNVPPPQLDFRGLGIRVPCLIVSPYVQAHVQHTNYEFGSIVKFVEQVFALPVLGTQSAGYTDGRANSLANSFDFSIAPRSFSQIPAPYSRSFFLNYKPSNRVPDDE
jgi:phospholipase C